MERIAKVELEEIEEKELAESKAAEPIKDKEDIRRISEYLVEQGRYRDNMLFIVGINVGLRVSDLIELRFSDFIDADGKYKTEFDVFEHKTRKSRKNPKNRRIGINEAVVWAIDEYLNNEARKGHKAKLNEYLFPATRSDTETGHINRKTVDMMIKGVIKDLGIQVKASTHTLRKTFGYQMMEAAPVGKKEATLLLLQEIYGHSDSRTTRRYIGITQDDITDAYLGLNLGLGPRLQKWYNEQSEQASSEQVECDNERSEQSERVKYVNFGTGNLQQVK